MNRKFASIDVGSNTILMLVGELLPDGSIRTIRDEHSIARLGENVNKTGVISKAAIARALPIFEKYRKIAREENVEAICACATSAVRDAGNKAEFLPLFDEALGEKIHVIHGETEATLSFLGSTEDLTRSTIIDIGGGSTEFICGENSVIEYKTSLNFGAVKLKEKFFRFHPAPPDILRAAEEAIRRECSILPEKIFSTDKIYSVAGTPTSIAAIYHNIREFDYEKIHLFRLTPQIVDDVFDLVMSHSLAELIERYNIHPQRADILPAGVSILKTVMKQFSIGQIIVSAKGLRYGILKNMITNQISVG